MRRHPINLLAALLIVTLGAAARPAHAQSIDFDRFSGGQPVPDGAVITGQYASLGVTFSSPAPAGGPTAGVFAHESSSGPNFLTGLDPVTHAGIYPIEVSFAAPFTDRVDVTLISVGCATVTATAYDSDANILDGVSLTRGPAAGVGLGNHDRISLVGDGMARVRFEISTPCPTGDGFGIDDLEFSLLTGTPFATFAPSLILSLGPSAGDDTLTMKGTFAPAAESDGVHPLIEDVTVIVGRFSRTISAGKFKLDSGGAFRFSGSVGGATLNVRIFLQADGLYAFTATAKSADLLVLERSIPVGLRIGNDGAAAQLTTLKVNASQ